MASLRIYSNPNQILTCHATVRPRLIQDHAAITLVVDSQDATVCVQFNAHDIRAILMDLADLNYALKKVLDAALK